MVLYNKTLRVNTVPRFKKRQHFRARRRPCSYHAAAPPSNSTVWLRSYLLRRDGRGCCGGQLYPRRLTAQLVTTFSLHTTGVIGGVQNNFEIDRFHNV